MDILKVIIVAYSLMIFLSIAGEYILGRMNKQFHYKRVQWLHYLQKYKSIYIDKHSLSFLVTMFQWSWKALPQAYREPYSLYMLAEMTERNIVCLFGNPICHENVSQSFNIQWPFTFKLNVETLSSPTVIFDLRNVASYFY